MILLDILAFLPILILMIPAAPSFAISVEDPENFAKREASTASQQAAGRPIRAGLQLRGLNNPIRRISYDQLPQLVDLLESF
jgi:hypothetical protein